MTSINANPCENVVVHPLVLLSVVDHFNRMKQVGNTKRVVGLLLGSLRNKVLDIANSFAGETLDGQKKTRLEVKTRI